ncbi:DUF2252 family protein [Fischerella sp.]|jgi:hypothetical protein|uniref:DUF2252 family protein n=1 Tax=Fischerella sp. TaxID=1191 RepID=UPI0025B91A41|nr:DUF2252 family protein [Fischerella sp.]
MLQNPVVRTPVGISLGAIAGALSRYYLGLWFTQLFGTGFPYSTLIVNVSGCFVMVFFTTLALGQVIAIHPDIRLKDMKTSIKLKGMSARSLEDYAEICGCTLARAHARSGDAVMISSYLGKSDTFDSAVTDFAVTYAHQVEQDYQVLVAAVKSGRIEAK